MAPHEFVEEETLAGIRIIAREAWGRERPAGEARALPRTRS